MDMAAGALEATNRARIKTVFHKAKRMNLSHVYMPLGNLHALNTIG